MWFSLDNLSLLMNDPYRPNRSFVQPGVLLKRWKCFVWSYGSHKLTRSIKHFYVKSLIVPSIVLEGFQIFNYNFWLCSTWKTFNFLPLGRFLYDIVLSWRIGSCKFQNNSKNIFVSTIAFLCQTKIIRRCRWCSSYRMLQRSLS